MKSPLELLLQDPQWAIAIWGLYTWIALAMIATLWIKYSSASLFRKFIWSIILLVPFVGWALYLGLFRVPPPNKAGETAQGTDVSGGGHL